MSGTTWVYIMLGLYIIYCFYWGLKGYFTEKTSSGYAIAGRSIPFFAFLLAATAASFSGWTFIGHPGLIWRDGLAYAFASFYVLTIPITGTFFSKRTWLLGKRYGFITPGDMYAYYFNNETLRWLVVCVAVLYSIFYSAVQLMAAGALFNVIAGVPTAYGAIFLALIVWFYVCTGGLKASTWVGVIQFVLLVGGIIWLLGLAVALSLAGAGPGDWYGAGSLLSLLDTLAVGLIALTAGRELKLEGLKKEIDSGATSLSESSITPAGPCRRQPFAVELDAREGQLERLAPSELPGLHPAPLPLRLAVARRQIRGPGQRLPRRRPRLFSLHS